MESEAWKHEPRFAKSFKPLVEVHGSSESRRKTIQPDQNIKEYPAHFARTTWSSPIPGGDKMGFHVSNGSPGLSPVMRHSKQPEHMPIHGVSKRDSVRDKSGLPTGPNKSILYEQNIDSEHDVISRNEGLSGQQLDDPKNSFSDLPNDDEPMKILKKPESKKRHSLDLESELSDPKEDQTCNVSRFTEKRSGDDRFYEIENKTCKMQKAIQMNESESKATLVSPKQPDLENACLLEEINEIEQMEPFSAVINKIKQLRDKNETLKAGIISSQTELNSVLSSLSSKDSWFRQYVTATSEKVKSVEREKAVYVDTIRHFEEEAEMAKKTLSSKLLKITELEDEAKSLKEHVTTANSKTESLKATLVASFEQREILEEENVSLASQNEKMIKEVHLLEKSLDEKALSNQELDVKFNNLVRETQALSEEMALFEKEHRSLKDDLQTKEEIIASLKVKQDQVNQENCNFLNENDRIKTLLDEMKAKNESLSRMLEKAQMKIGALETQAMEKDLIISGDTDKLKDLNLQVNRQKSIITEMRKETKETFAGHEKSESELLQQVVNLKDQILAAQRKSDERIQEIAEQLYHQYSKKHEIKVSQLRKNYEMKIEDKITQVKDQEKKIENLENHLRMEIKEKEYLLKVIEKGRGDRSEVGTGNEIRF